MKKILLITVLSYLLVASPAMAKEGFYLGAGLTRDQMLSSDLRSLDPAVGLDIKVGYNFGSFALEGNILGSDHGDTRPGFGDADFSGLSIDFRIPLFQAAQENKVYVVAGLAGYTLKEHDPALGEVKYTGGGLDLGAGVEHYFNPNVAFNLAVIYRTINYDKKESQGTTVSLSPKINGDVLTVEVGLNYYF